MSFSIGTQVVFIGCAILIGYVYPFVVIFRGGSWEKCVVRTWVWMLLYTIFLSFALREVVEKYLPQYSREMDWVPEGNAVAATLFMGWMYPLIGGTLGHFMRSFAMKRFPKWMDRISIHQSSIDPKETHGTHS